MAALPSAVGKELHVLSHHLELATLLPCSLVIPRIHLEAALNIDGPTLPEILLSKLSLPRPQRDIDECRLLYPLALVIVPHPVHR